jgi:N-glycosylase/DNA lyase
MPARVWNGVLRVDTALGPFAVAWTDRGVARIWLPHDEHAPVPTGPTPPASVARIGPLLVDYALGVPVRFDVPIDLTGVSPYRSEVMEAARHIPPGTTVSYGDLARATGRPGAARAVGQVMARNPLPILVPCQRVVAASGQLHEYSGPGGIDTKARLLALERTGPVHELTLSLAAPSGFGLAVTVLSHGWYDLAPFVRLAHPPRLRRALDLDDARTATIEIDLPAAPARHITGRAWITGEPAPGPSDLAAIEQALRAMFCLDADLADFHAVAAAHPAIAWAVRLGAGRFLRAPTAYEDLVRTILTTNCAWSSTRRMVARLVDALGRPAPLGLRTFPTPAAMAAAPGGPAFYRDVLRAGYRAASLHELASRVASGTLDPEAWRTSAAHTADLRGEILAVRGAGPYAADTMLRLLGRHDGLALDSWCRATYQRLHGLDRRPSDDEIAAHYRNFGRWRGLALWLDLTRDWHAGTTTGSAPAADQPAATGSIAASP